jgi:hypothetical protein
VQKALTPRAPKPAAPKKSRRQRGGEDERSALRFIRTIQQRQQQRAALWLSNTLDWLNQWHDTSRGFDAAGGDHYRHSPANHLSPRL